MRFKLASPMDIGRLPTCETMQFFDAVKWQDTEAESSTVGLVVRILEMQEGLELEVVLL
jgi:hypothetical protein